MSIYHPQLLPTAGRGFRRAIFGGEALAGASESPHSLARQVVARPGERWRVQVSMPPIRDVTIAEAWATFLTSLRGMVEPFLIGPSLRGTPRGTPAGTPVIDGDHPSGEFIATRGWTPDATGVLLAGDYIQIGGGRMARLYKVLEDVDADASGEATLRIWPALQTSSASASERIVNGGFENWSGANDADNWDELSSGTAVYSQDSVTPYAGSISAKLNRNNTTDWHAYKQSAIALQAGKPYRLRWAWKGQTATGSSDLAFYLINGNAYEYGQQRRLHMTSAADLGGAWHGKSGATRYSNPQVTWVLNETGFFVDRHWTAADLAYFFVQITCTIASWDAYFDGVSLYGPSHDGMPIITSNPVGCFRMTEQGHPWDVDYLQAFGFSFEAASDV